MDDPNNPSIPASNAFPTPESAVPEMPMPVPITQPTASPSDSGAILAGRQFGGQATPTPDLPPVLPMAPEVEWPGSKPKSKLPQILSGIAAIILVVGVATAAYFVSNKISGRQAVAPTAPESDPLAYKGKSPAGSKVSTGLSGAKGGVTAGGGGTTGLSGAKGGVSGGKGGESDDDSEQTGLSGAKAGVTAGGSGTTGLSGAKAGVTAGGGGSDGGSTTYCSSFNTRDCLYGCTPTTDGGSCNSKPGTTTTTTSGGGGTTTTTTTKKTGGGGGGEEGGTTATSCTEQCPGSDGVLRSCTPPEADGSSNDSLCNSAGRVESCGGNNYCCPSAGGTWTTDMAACPVDSTVVPGACMEVKLYAKLCQNVAGQVACQAEGYSTTPMTETEKAALKVGYKIRIAITGSKANLKARFRVLIDNVVETPEWKLGQGYSGADNKTMLYSDYEIKKSGNYMFEGQVTTEP